MNKYWKSSLLLPILFQASISSAVEQKPNANDFHNVEQNMQKNRKGLLLDDNLVPFPIPSYFNLQNTLDVTNNSLYSSYNSKLINTLNSLNKHNLNFNNFNVSSISSLYNKVNTYNYIKKAENIEQQNLIKDNYISEFSKISNFENYLSFLKINSIYIDNFSNNNISKLSTSNHFSNSFFIFYVLSLMVFFTFITQLFTRKILKHHYLSFWKNELFLIKSKIKNLYKHILFYKGYIHSNIRKIEYSINFKQILISNHN